MFSFFFIDYFLESEREEGGKRKIETERQTDIDLLLHTYIIVYVKCVPWLGTEPAALVY